MKPPDQARWNPMPGNVASDGKTERTVVGRSLQAVTYQCHVSGRLACCSLQTWIDWVTEVVHVEQ